MRINKFVSGKDSKVNYYTSVDLCFLCEMRGKGYGEHYLLKAKR